MCVFCVRPGPGQGPGPGQVPGPGPGFGSGPGAPGSGYSRGGGGGGGGGGGAPWERGANLQEYYARKDEQEANAVGHFLFFLTAANQKSGSTCY